MKSFVLKICSLFFSLSTLLTFFSISPLTFMLSCSSNTTSDKTPAEVLYQEAQEHAKKERYLLATEKLNSIKSQYPYSYYAAHADLLLADILFLQESYVEAAGAYLSFKELHPKHEKLSYVVWKTADSYYKQLPSTSDRDLSPAKEAIKYYQEVINKYPESEYVEEAKVKIKSIEEMIMQQELYIADFYFKTDVYDSAQFRYLEIIKKYNDSKVLDHAMLGVVKSSLYQNNFPECVKYANEYATRTSDSFKKDVLNLQKECALGEERMKFNIERHD